MASGSLISAWWDRLGGRLQPEPFPFAEAAVLDMPRRRLVASPGIGYYSVEAARRIGAGVFSSVSTFSMRC